MLLLLLLQLSSQVVSSTRLRVDNSNAFKLDKNPHAWLAEPGLLKVVAVDTGAGLVRLNPDEGGVVVAVVKADVTVQDNPGLYIYPSTKQIQVTGSGFEDKITVRLSTRAIHLLPVLVSLAYAGSAGAYWKATIFRLATPIVSSVVGRTKCTGQLHSAYSSVDKGRCFS